MRCPPYSDRNISVLNWLQKKSLAKRGPLIFFPFIVVGLAVVFMLRVSDRHCVGTSLSVFCKRSFYTDVDWSGFDRLLVLNNFYFLTVEHQGLAKS